MTPSKRRKIFLVILVFSFLLFWGMGRWPTGRLEGGPLLPPASSASAPTRLRLATFNIHSGVGTDDRRDLGRTAGVVANADFVAMQEVAGDRPWEHNEAFELSRLLGMSGLFLPTETHFWYPVFGNAILTRTKIDHWTRIPLPNGFHMAHRDMVRLSVPFGEKTLNVLVVHMGKKSDRARQFDVVTDAFQAMPEPAVLMGDLNTRPCDRMMEDFLKRSNAHDVVGEHVAPVDRVDFIITKGVRCSDAGLTPNDASDHPAAWAVIEADE